MGLAEKKRRLIESIKLLAAEPEDQLSCFPEFIHKPDEIALMFNDNIRFSSELLESNFLTATELQAICDVDQKFKEITDSNFWTESAIYTDDRWRKFRVRARALLKLLKEPEGVPNLDWCEFVKARR